jgi:hypothetical protein
MRNKEIFKNITDRISITPEKTILLDGQPYGNEFKNSYTTQLSSKMLFDLLQNLLYTNFYSGADKKDAPVFNDLIKLEEEITEFNEHLGSCNHSVEKFDSGWVIDQIDTMGNMTAVKGNLKKQLAIGEFINDTAFGRNTEKKESVKLFMRKEHASPMNGFYYVFGNTPGEDNPDMLVRIYFNIKHTAVHKLVHLLTGKLNNYSVPFSFKCLNHPSYYKRKDSAVLYTEKKYFRIVSWILAEHYNDFRRDLLDAIPLFTKELAPGIAFAENPFRIDESFGTHCCKMIAQGLISAWNKNLQKKEWLNEITETIEKVHFYPDADVLYINPGSRYPYDFNIFKKL